MTWSGRKIERLRRLVYSTYGAECWLCHQHIDLALSALHPQGPTIDHVQPRSRGGADWLGNLRPAHRACNLERGAKLATENRTARTDTSFLVADPSRKPRPTSISPLKPLENG